MKSDTIQLSDGSGGRQARALIDREIVSRFGAGPLQGLPDAARLAGASPLLFTTDSFVVKPLFFPGGDIGRLAVHGTVNDLAVAGGRPRWLSLALILEEGLPLEALGRVLDSVKAAASECGVTVATGDTKVVGRGQCDGLFINTAGIGEAIPGLRLSPGDIRPGDAVLASGTLGDHGMAVMAARESFGIAQGCASDTGPVHRLVEAAARVAGGAIRFMRDPTRGGAAAVLNEIAEGRPFGLSLREALIPFSAGARAVAELLGLDLMHSASEGRLLMVCDAGAAPPVIEAWRRLPEGRGAAVIGEATERHPGTVSLVTLTGGCRLVDVPDGELLPRIC